MSGEYYYPTGGPGAKPAPYPMDQPDPYRMGQQQQQPPHSYHGAQPVPYLDFGAQPPMRKPLMAPPPVEQLPAAYPAEKPAMYNAQPPYLDFGAQPPMRKPVPMYPMEQLPMALPAEKPAAYAVEKPKAYYTETPVMHPSGSPPAYSHASESDDEDLDTDEEAWAMDELHEKHKAAAAREAGHEHETHEHKTKADKLAFLVPPMPPAGVRRQLPYPVMLPQRRCGNRTRGFVRAYAPDLLAYGVDEPCWLSFLEALDANMANSPWLTGINVAGGVVGLIPKGVVPGMAILGFSIQLTVGVAQELLLRKGQNSFILKMNEEFFKPRGLYCLIMTYDPSTTDTLVQSTMTASTGARDHRLIRDNDGKTGPLEFPPSARLVYPRLPVPAGAAVEGHQSWWSKKSSAWDRYWDAKATVRYMKKNPDAPLDSLLDLSNVKPEDRRKIEDARRKFESTHGPHSGKEGPYVHRKRWFRKKIMYLMVVELPTKEETEAAMQILRMHQQQKGHHGF
ncbi:hypothetical protein GGR56DRAFT_453847 [Xylariaceae sp. FL0804]|nr:hypothetical protein GGR56DRAFT_453847 [Xylariaceae sp. FL0804]